MRRCCSNPERIPPQSPTVGARTRDCFEDFVKVLGTADAVLLTEVYAAGESPIVAADGRALTRAVRVAGKVEPGPRFPWHRLHEE